MVQKERPAAVVRGEPGGSDHASGLIDTPIKPTQGVGQGAKLPSPDIVVAVFEVSWRAQVRITINTWRGRTKVHVREYNPGALPNSWWPGKGACLDIEKLPELVEAVQKAEAEARRLGLLPEGVRP